MNDNILAINIPNGISILVMGAVGALILMALRKASGAKSSPVGNAPQGGGFANQGGSNIAGAG